MLLFNVKISVKNNFDGKYIRDKATVLKIINLNNF